jgi:hypothetical protein
MSRDEMKAKIAAVIGDAILGKTATQGASAAAAVVLDLCGPKPLEWIGGSAITANGTWYLFFRTAFDNVGEEFRSQYTLTMSNDFSRKFATLEAAQAAAQAHHEAAHWANTKMGDL